MSTIFGFLVGYIVGARAGSDGYGRVEQALREIRDSEEFRNFVDVLRSHAQGVLRTVSDRLGDPQPVMPELDLLAAQARARLSQALDPDT